MKFPSKALIGFFIFISIYIGALYAFAVNVAPGTVLDPAGLPGAYTVSAIGYESNGDLFIEKNFGGGLTGGYQLSSDVLGTGISGSGLYMSEGTDVNITGVADFGFSSNISVVHYTDTATEDITFAGAGKIGGNPVVALSAANDNTGDDTFALLSLSTGFFIQGKDDLDSSTAFKIVNESSNALIEIMNDGSFTQAWGDAELVNKTITIPLLGSSPYSGALYQPSAGVSFDIGINQLGGGNATVGAHFIDSNNNQLVGFDLVNIDQSIALYSNDTGTGSTASITAFPDRVDIVGSPDSVLFNRIQVFQNTNGILFSSLDDLGTSTLVDFENASGVSLMTIKSDGQIGIGPDVNPNYPLEVHGDAATPWAAYFDSDWLSTRLAINNDSGNTGFGLLINDTIRFSNSVVQYNAGNYDFAIYNDQLGNKAVQIDGDTNFMIINASNATLPDYQLDVRYGGSGTVAAFTDNTATCIINPTGNDISCSSDERLKKNISGLDSQEILQKVLALRGVTYEWLHSTNTETHLGFIAQELEAVFPEFVGEDARGYKSVSYGSLTPVLVEAIKALDMKIAPLTSLDVTHPNSLASLVKQYLENTANNLSRIFVGSVQTHELCLDDVCVTKTELEELLNLRNQSGTQSTVAPDQNETGGEGDTNDQPMTGEDTSSGNESEGESTPLPEALN